MDSDELLALLAAVGHPQRLRVIAELADGRQYVSELARRLEMSRPLLYMHLDRLEKVGLVVGSLNASEEGKALKYFELVPFELNLNTDLILGVVQADDAWAEASTPWRMRRTCPAPRPRCPTTRWAPGRGSTTMSGTRVEVLRDSHQDSAGFLQAAQVDLALVVVATEATPLPHEDAVRLALSHPLDQLGDLALGERAASHA